MDPQDFLDTASSLVNSPREADLRTSVSRSYYAVILFFRNYFAKEVGFSPENPDFAIHKVIPEFFNISNSEEATKIGEKIKRLKAGRRDADYILSKVISGTKASDHLDLAKKLITCSITGDVEKAVLEHATKRARVRRLIQ